MGLMILRSLFLLCLLAWLSATFPPSKAAFVTDIKVDEEDNRDLTSEITVKDFIDKNQMLLAENTLILSYLTEEAT
ncbi:hypothetical protein X943_000765 [Babesia divergens]|uniref:Uncharacterized protein n=1 Tax=Babesia divergens TaxID=32595 RepID=A0AAD9GJD3_BABDI|nr:hypothetical protein X943_000765 [Babesia divergens]